jgi:hypothetical protein
VLAGGAHQHDQEMRNGTEEQVRSA